MAEDTKIMYASKRTGGKSSNKGIPVQWFMKDSIFLNIMFQSLLRQPEYNKKKVIIDTL